MSLLNLPSVGLHGVLAAIYRLLGTERKPVPRERLEALCGPEHGVKPTHLSNTVRNWVKIGLFVEDGEGIALDHGLSAEERRPGALPRVARRYVLHADNNRDLWANEEAHAADFTRALGWLLAQDVYETELTGWPTAERRVQAQLPKDRLDENNKDKKFIVNDTRWNGLKAWASWLGFGWRGLHPNSVLTIDPTEAVRDALPQIFHGRKPLAAEAVVAGLADILPVLDGGVYRLAVEEEFLKRTGTDAWQSPPEGQLSTSLSRALLRLVQDGTLRTENRADAPGRVRLTGRKLAVIETFSHFRLV